MAEPNPGYQASEGTPNQLPRGAAEAANEGTNVVAPDPIQAAVALTAPDGMPEPAAPAEEDVPTEPATPEDFLPDFQPATEDEAFLTGPTMRPDEAQTVGTTPRRGLAPNVKRNLGLLQQAAALPNASPELRALVQFLLRNQ